MRNSWQVDGRRPRLRVADSLTDAGIDEPLTAVRPRLDDGKWIVETVWTNLHTPMFMSSPVLVGDTIDGLAQRSNGRSSRSMRPAVICLELLITRYREARR
jgi:hypothetical protein